MDRGVGHNFLASDVDQGFLLPPDMREWLDPDHLAFFVMDAVAQFDMSGFNAGYRCDGRGGAAYEPRLLVGLLLFAYCDGVKSSRQIERRCVRDVAYRVLVGNRLPDHATIARFRDRHRAALQQLFVQVLRLCAEAGLVRVGLVALDGTKLRADASPLKNYDQARVDKAIASLDQQIGQMLAAAEQVDAVEDAAVRDGADPGPPVELKDRQRRLAKLKEAKGRLDAQVAEAQRVQDQRRADFQAGSGLRGAPPAEKPPKEALTGLRTNLTDPDSRVMHVSGGFAQAYNGQAVVTADQVIIEAEVVPAAVDFDAFHPLLDQARANLDEAGVADPIRAVTADAGYSSAKNRHHERGGGNNPIQLVSVPGLGGKKSADQEGRPDPRLANDPALGRMAKRLANPAGRRLYARRKVMVEPVFGQLKQRSGPRLQHRGMDKVNTEWKMMAAAHNLLKCWRRHTLQMA